MKAIYDTCRRRHVFARGNNHPKNAGGFVCPFCMFEQLSNQESIGSFTAQETIEVMEATKELEQKLNGESRKPFLSRDIVPTIKHATAEIANYRRGVIVGGDPFFTLINHTLKAVSK